MMTMAKAMAGAALLALAGCATVPAPAPAPAQGTAVGETDLRRDLFAAGVQRFLFDGWAGPAFPVWTYRSPDTPADAPILFVFHGVQRDADNCMRQWLDLGRGNKIILIVPEYDRKAFPGVGAYSHGWFTKKDGTARPADRWSFAAIEPIFAAVRKREGLTAERYSIYGHSGGAQFVHRFVLAGGGPHLARAVSANAGSYAMTDPKVDWPFGLGGLPDGLWQPARAFAVPMTVLLGTADTDPHHHSLPSQPEAQAEGPHRLARGTNFYGTAREMAAEQKIPFTWSCGLVTNADHDNAKMAPTAVTILFGSVKLKAGGDCTVAGRVE